MTFAEGFVGWVLDSEERRKIVIGDIRIKEIWHLAFPCGDAAWPCHFGRLLLELSVEGGRPVLDSLEMHGVKGWRQFWTPPAVPGIEGWYARRSSSSALLWEIGRGCTKNGKKSHAGNLFVALLPLSEGFVKVTLRAEARWVVTRVASEWRNDEFLKGPKGR
ncbi:MAG: hypothetical protein V1821_02075 [bacterium]